MSMPAVSPRTPNNLLAAVQKRVAEGSVHTNCEVCGKPVKKWKSQLARAKWAITCGPACRSETMKGPSNPNWKGGLGWCETRTGYRLVSTDKLSEADRALLPTPVPREYLEHRLVMARSLGRPLRPEEHVHHLNGEKADNRLENLELMDWSEHSREHRVMERRLSKLQAENRRLKAQIAELERR